MEGTRDRSVAIITRTRDRIILLSRAVESVLAQNHSDWRHVIVNDGGDPGDVEQLLAPFRERYADRLIVIHHEQSLGMEAASNAGIRGCDSRYVAIHDDDDSWHPAFLSRCVEELEAAQDSSVRGVVTRITQIHEQIDSGEVRELRRQDYNPSLNGISLPQMVELNQFLPIAFVYERGVYDKVGYYDETLPVVGDWDFNIRFLVHFDMCVLAENLAYYHVRVQANDQYRNSVNQEGLHEHYRAMVVNRYLRRDIAEGRVGLGQLMAMGDALYRTNRDVGRIGRLLDKVKALGLVSWLRVRLKL